MDEESSDEDSSDEENSVLKTFLNFISTDDKESGKID